MTKMAVIFFLKIFMFFIFLVSVLLSLSLLLLASVYQINERAILQLHPVPADDFAYGIHHLLLGILYSLAGPTLDSC